MQVTLDIFSGMPNPTWTLTPKQAKDLISRLAGKAMAAVDATDGALGFRGYILSTATDDTATAADAGLPEVFRIPAGGMDGFVPAHAADLETLGLPSAQDMGDAAEWLLGTGGGAVDDELLNLVKGMMGEAGRAPAAEAADMAAAACVIQNTAYNPGFWNTPSVQPYNNCYNYAMNFRSNTFAQPGKISGHPNSVMQCANVSAAANWDGCKATCSGPNKNVALVVWPGRDYHWYRRHSNGFWGHKPGSTAARNTDNSGRVIGGALTPQNCNRGPYTSFCGYRFSPVGMKVS
jgi:hypothetical protein